MQHAEEPREPSFYVATSKVAVRWRLGRYDLRIEWVVFILIGLQLPFVRSQLSGIRQLPTPAGGCLSISIVLLRLILTFAETYSVYWYCRLRRHANNAAPRPKELLVLSWGGMRGVLFAGRGLLRSVFPRQRRKLGQRSRIVYLTFCLIVTSLVLQGLTMPSLNPADGDRQHQ